jgi:hypothetical protein
MIEYIYDVIRATSGQPFQITAKLTKDDNTPITTPCFLAIYDINEENIVSIEGTNAGDGLWVFPVPAEITKGRKGKHWYCLGNEGVNLCFKKPLYLK